MIDIICNRTEGLFLCALTFIEYIEESPARRPHLTASLPHPATRAITSRIDLLWSLEGYHRRPPRECDYWGCWY